MLETSSIVVDLLHGRCKTLRAACIVPGQCPFGRSGRHEQQTKVARLGRAQAKRDDRHPSPLQKLKHLRQIPALLRDWASRLRVMARENAAASPVLMRQNLVRMRIACVVVAAANLIHALAFWSGPEPADAVVRNWRYQIGLAHALMFGLTVPLGVLTHVRLQGEPARWLDAGFALLGVCTALGFSAALTLIDQQVTSHIIPVVLGAMAVSAVYLIRPLHAVALFSAAGAVVVVALQLTQADSAARLSNQANVLTCLTLCIVFSVQLWRRATQDWLMQRELLEQNHQLELQCETLDRLASHDELTGLLNRRELMRQAETELLRAKRRGSHTSLLLIDLDHFKKINDAHGHPIGDQALMHATQVLRSRLRRTDLLGRLGGEEFVAVLPDTGLAVAEAVAVDLCRTLRDAPCRVGGDEILLTASMGVAVCAAGDPSSMERLYRHADGALYRAKHQGRDRVVSWTESVAA